MPNTLNRGYPYPDANAAPDVPLRIQQLAESVDADVKKVTDGLTVILSTAAPAAGVAKPAGSPWKIFEGAVTATQGAGGEDFNAASATDVNGYGGVYLGKGEVPNFSGIYSATLQSMHGVDAFQFVSTVASISLVRIKFRARKLDNTGWANGYGSMTHYVRILGW